MASSSNPPSSSTASASASNGNYDVPWMEKFRPSRVADIVGNTEAVSRLQIIAHDGNMPNLILSGPPGTGKTTIIHALAHELLGPNCKDAVLELNASDDRFPFTMLVLQKAVTMVCDLPEVKRVAYIFLVLILIWMALWSFGVAGVVALSMDDNARWWLLVVLSVSLFWTGAVFCNTVHIIVSGMVFLVLIHGGRRAATMPPKPLMKSIRYAVTTSFGSICYGSLFTAAIRTLRWEIRGVRSKIGNNECLLCCIDFLFHLVETLVRFFNKYAYVQIAVNGKSFNRSARDAWELFQSTGIEALIAYDCSGAVLLMTTIFGGLITGTCAGVWTWYKRKEEVIMVGSTSILMGMILMGLAVVVVESAVTSIYICFAEDPSLIQRWDAEFYNQMSEVLHQRLQYRSARARQGMDGRFDQIPDSPSI